MKTHKCEPTDFCVCGTLAEEPDDECPVHGLPHPKEVYRCIHCGRFMPYKNSFVTSKDEIVFDRV